MNTQQYQEFCKSLWKSDEKTKEMQLAIAALGLVGESGETADFIKKSLRNVKFPLQIDKIKLELGDVLYYVCTIATLLGISLDEIIDANAEKLTARNEEGSIIDPTRRVQQYELFASIDRPANWAEKVDHQELMQKIIDHSIELHHKAKVSEFEQICASGDIRAMVEYCRKSNIEMSKLYEVPGFSEWIKRAKDSMNQEVKKHLPTFDLSDSSIKNNVICRHEEFMQFCAKNNINPKRIKHSDWDIFIKENSEIEKANERTPRFTQPIKFDSTPNGVHNDGFVVYAVDIDGNKNEITAESTDEPDNQVTWAFSESNKRDSLTLEQLAWREKLMAGLAVEKHYFRDESSQPDEVVPKPLRFSMQYPESLETKKEGDE